MKARRNGSWLQSLFFHPFELSLMAPRSLTWAHVNQPNTRMHVAKGSQNLDHHNSWQSERCQIRMSNCRSVALQALLYFNPMWPRRSGPKRLGSEHCGAALTTPSPGRAFTAVPHPRLGRCLSTLVRLAGPSSPLCHALGRRRLRVCGCCWSPAHRACGA